MFESRVSSWHSFVLIFAQCFKYAISFISFWYSFVVWTPSKFVAFVRSDLCSVFQVCYTVYIILIFFHCLNPEQVRGIRSFWSLLSISSMLYRLYHFDILSLFEPRVSSWHSFVLIFAQCFKYAISFISFWYSFVVWTPSKFVAFVRSDLCSVFQVCYIFYIILIFFHCLNPEWVRGIRSFWSLLSVSSMLYLLYHFDILSLFKPRVSSWHSFVLIFAQCFKYAIPFISFLSTTDYRLFVKRVLVWWLGKRERKFPGYHYFLNSISIFSLLSFISPTSTTCIKRTFNI